MGSELILRLPLGWAMKPLIECTSDNIISYGVVQPGSHTETGIPIIRVNNFGNGKLDLSTVLKIEPEIEKKFSRTRLVGGEVLLTLVGSTGQSIVASKELAGWNVPRAVAVIRPSNDIGANWINICLQTEFTKHFLDSRANTTVQKTLNLADVKKIPIPIPPRDVKDFIESNIISLDNKIQLNRQTNQTLEAMAQALFKSWFVDFDPVFDNIIAHNLAHNNAPLHNIPEPLLPHAQRRLNVHNECSGQNNAQEFHHLFPQAFEQSDEPSVGIQGWVPKGWGVNSVESLVSRLKSGKRYSKKDVLPYGQTPVFEQGQSILLGYHNDEANFLASIEDPVFIFGDHTCVTKLGVVPFSISANVIPLKGLIRNTYWTYFAVKDLQEFEEYRRHWMEFAIRPVVTPTVAVADLFADIICPLQQKSNDLETSSNYLGRLRDTLLPKLISGELRIPDAEQATEALAK